MSSEKCHRRELGSSLPSMGGDVTMTTYEKLSLLIQFSMLIVEVIRCFYS